MTDLANFLYNERISQNLTRKELSKLSGASITSLYNYEKGIIEPSFFMAECIINALGYKIEITLEG